jgi:hypothetical protein
VRRGMQGPAHAAAPVDVAPPAPQSRVSHHKTPVANSEDRRHRLTV